MHFISQSQKALQLHWQVRRKLRTLKFMSQWDVSMSPTSQWAPRLNVWFSIPIAQKFWAPVVMPTTTTTQRMLKGIKIFDTNRPEKKKGYLSYSLTLSPNKKWLPGITQNQGAVVWQVSKSLGHRDPKSEHLGYSGLSNITCGLCPAQLQTMQVSLVFCFVFTVFAIEEI